MRIGILLMLIVMGVSGCTRSRDLTKTELGLIRLENGIVYEDEVLVESNSEWMRFNSGMIVDRVARTCTGVAHDYAGNRYDTTLSLQQIDKMRFQMSGTVTTDDETSRALRTGDWWFTYSDGKLQELVFLEDIDGAKREARIRSDKIRVLEINEYSNGRTIAGVFMLGGAVVLVTTPAQKGVHFLPPGQAILGFLLFSVGLLWGLLELLL